MHGFFGIIDSMHDISSDTEKSAIFQMHKIKEAYEESGQSEKSCLHLKKYCKAQIVLRFAMPAYFMLSDSIKESGQHNKAIELLKESLKENIKKAN